MHWNWLKKQYNNLTVTAYCFQLLNTMKLHSVLYLKYSPHKLKKNQEKANKYEWQKSFMYQQPKYLKII